MTDGSTGHEWEARVAELAAAWQAGDLDTVERGCEALVDDEGLPPQVRSWAHLSWVQCLRAGDDDDGARAQLARLVDDERTPEVHRQEARQQLTQLERLASGRPARDPAASRTRLAPVEAFAAEIRVAPEGDDTATGSAASPLRTLTAARDAVRRLRAAGIQGAVAVTLAPGEYPATATLELTAQDSGGPGAPVVYRAARPGTAVLYGGTRLGGFVPVTDPDVLARLPETAREHVVECDLRAQGITDYGQLRTRGYAQQPSPPTLEVMLDGRPLTPARWPNEGFVSPARLVEAGSPVDGTPAVLEYSDDRHERWVDAPDAYLFGYFRFLWADASIPVGRIDPEARTLTTAEPYGWRTDGMSTQQGIIYYVYNLLEELDAAGEWYLDRRTGKLYLYPPADIDSAVVEIGLLPAAMVRLEGVHDVRLEGLSLDLGRLDGMVLRGCSRCVVAGCTVARLAGTGITIDGGQECVLLGCDLRTTGRRGTEVLGGDRETLTPGGHLVENCRIHDVGRLDRTYTPAIQLEGVGHRVAHNLMYDVPSSAMRIEGNDHVIEYNDVHSVVRESDDQGGMELFLNPSYRGVVFRHNRYVNVGKTGAETAVHGQAAIRLDDAISGIQVYGNVFVRSANGKFGGVQLNSGRDNVIDNNLFVDCKQGVSGGWNAGNTGWQMLRDGERGDFYRTDLYLERYPLLATTLDEPGVNHVWRNLLCCCGPITTGRPEFLDLMANTEVGHQTLGLAHPRDADPATVQAKAAPLGFCPIPVDEIGLYADAHRASWPVDVEPVDLPDWRGDG